MKSISASNLRYVSNIYRPTWVMPTAGIQRERNYCSCMPIKAQIPLCWLSPTLPCGESREHKRWQIMNSWSFSEIRRYKSRKSRTQTISRCRDVCEKVRDNKVQDKFLTKSRTCRGHKSWKSATWFVSQTFMICVRNKSTTLLGTCAGLCRKVGVMEFWLKR